MTVHGDAQMRAHATTTTSTDASVPNANCSGRRRVGITTLLLLLMRRDSQRMRDSTDSTAAAKGSCEISSGSWLSIPLATVAAALSTMTEPWRLSTIAMVATMAAIAWSRLTSGPSKGGRNSICGRWMQGCKGPGDMQTPWRGARVCIIVSMVSSAREPTCVIRFASAHKSGKSSRHYHRKLGHRNSGEVLSDSCGVVVGKTRHALNCPSTK